MVRGVRVAVRACVLLLVLLHWGPGGGAEPSAAACLGQKSFEDPSDDAGPGQLDPRVGGAPDAIEILGVGLVDHDTHLEYTGLLAAAPEPGPLVVRYWARVPIHHEGAIHAVEVRLHDSYDHGDLLHIGPDGVVRGVIGSVSVTWIEGDFSFDVPRAVLDAPFGGDLRVGAPALTSDGYLPFGIGTGTIGDRAGSNLFMELEPCTGPVAAPPCGDLHVVADTAGDAGPYPGLVGIPGTVFDPIDILDARTWATEDTYAMAVTFAAPPPMERDDEMNYRYWYGFQGETDAGEPIGFDVRIHVLPYETGVVTDGIVALLEVTPSWDGATMTVHVPRWVLLEHHGAEDLTVGFDRVVTDGPNTRNLQTTTGFDETGPTDFVTARCAA